MAVCVESFDGDVGNILGFINLILRRPTWDNFADFTFFLGIGPEPVDFLLHGSNLVLEKEYLLV